ncbi:MAG: 23S rRNA (guanosine(2251)-2'-O)-methyltransferase RlmB [Acidobacteriaceae bacterium]|jgi:23S rRNA (guanosine2251-2'-O)-methyltransferase|nr:23S rRNA (guanosine(2251)-2'-O)-methyltransferase RlmB [Acidobacteriaceae bacterium]
MIIYGTNPVLEALKAGRVKTLRVSERAGGRLDEVVALAARAGVIAKRVTPAELDRAARGGVHQGVVADLVEREQFDVADLVDGAKAVPLLIVLDGVEDPHNVGAILRTVDAAGGDGVIRQSRHAAPLDGAAAKASAGAVSHVKVADVVNIARALEELKARGVWTVGLAGEADKSLEDIDLTMPTALVLGAEGAGLRRLVRETCDLLASIPIEGHVQSLNVSVAAGVALFEAKRQRRMRARMANGV